VPADHTPGAVDAAAAPDAAAALMRAEGLEPYAWDNGPGYVYSAHRHAYDKVLFCVRGSIRFDLPDEGRSVELATGDRLDLPAGTAHGAVVGDEGVVCLEAQR
jgi:mannose-6-phosphate isomerase-like protein (cupin superfamily)